MHPDSRNRRKTPFGQTNPIDTIWINVHQLAIPSSDPITPGSITGRDNLSENENHVGENEPIGLCVSYQRTDWLVFLIEIQ